MRKSFPADDLARDSRFNRVSQADRLDDARRLRPEAQNVRVKFIREMAAFTSDEIDEIAELSREAAEEVA